MTKTLIECINFFEEIFGEIVVIVDLKIISRFNMKNNRVLVQNSAKKFGTKLVSSISAWNNFWASIEAGMD